MKQPRIRLMIPSDLAFADSLRAAAGWNQTLSDWQRFLACEPQGCFVAEWDGSPAGTATTIRYGTDLGWIGMVLVHPEQRRRGIGAALLEHCLGSLRDSGVRCIKLDATPLGRPLYEKLGFQAEWPLARWEAPAVPSIRLSSSPAIRAWQDGDLEPLLRLDQKAFAVSRRALLTAIREQSRAALVHVGPDNELEGYGLLRRGMRAAYLGPVVANSPVAALEIIQALLASIPGQPVFWDFPDSNRAALALAEKLGFKQQRPLLRMFQGENNTAGDPAMFYGIADPAVG